jgi:hypothetical protein
MTTIAGGAQARAWPISAADRSVHYSTLADRRVPLNLIHRNASDRRSKCP